MTSLTHKLLKNSYPAFTSGRSLRKSFFNIPLPHIRLPRIFLPQAVNPRPEPSGPTAGGPVLHVENVSWSTASGDRILHPTNFSARPGEVIAIVGANGAGKSTLLRSLYRVNKPTAGRILLGGLDIWQINAKQCAQSIAAVLQEYPVDFPLNVYEIVNLGRTPYQSALASFTGREEAEVTKAMEILGLSALRHRKFDTLSGGEKQRTMVARALAQNPEVIILDEPTNHLDIRHQLEVLKLIRGLNRTIIFSIHDLNLAARYADKLLILAQGTQLAFGAADEILHEDIIAKAFSVNAIKETLPKSGETHFSFSLV